MNCTYKQFRNASPHFVKRYNIAFVLPHKYIDWDKTETKITYKIFFPQLCMFPNIKAHAGKKQSIGYSGGPGLKYRPRCRLFCMIFCFRVFLISSTKISRKWTPLKIRPLSLAYSSPYTNHSIVTIAIRLLAGRSWVRIPLDQYWVSFPEIRRSERDADLHIVPRLRIRGAISLLPLHAFMALTGKTHADALRRRPPTAKARLQSQTVTCWIFG